MYSLSSRSEEFFRVGRRVWSRTRPDTVVGRRPSEMTPAILMSPEVALTPPDAFPSIDMSPEVACTVPLTEPAMLTVPDVICTVPTSPLMVIVSSRMTLSQVTGFTSGSSRRLPSMSMIPSRITILLPRYVFPLIWMEPLSMEMPPTLARPPPPPMLTKLYAITLLHNVQENK